MLKFQLIAVQNLGKDRRQRFNSLLDRLALHLPGAGKTGDSNWTKAQIVEQALKFVKLNRFEYSEGSKIELENPNAISILNILTF